MHYTLSDKPWIAFLLIDRIIRNICPEYFPSHSPSFFVPVNCVESAYVSQQLSFIQVCELRKPPAETWSSVPAQVMSALWRMHHISYSQFNMSSVLKTGMTMQGRRSSYHLVRDLYRSADGGAVYLAK